MPTRGTIRLGQFLKLADLVDQGSDAKALVSAGEVLVNGAVETRRGRQLVTGDVVTSAVRARASAAPLGSRRDPAMSKLDAQRAMREAKFAGSQDARAPRGADNGRPWPARRSPRRRRVTEPSRWSVRAPVDERPDCTRESGHAAKSHRYS